MRRWACLMGAGAFALACSSAFALELEGGGEGGDFVVSDGWTAKAQGGAAPSKRSSKGHSAWLKSEWARLTPKPATSVALLSVEPSPLLPPAKSGGGLTTFLKNQGSGRREMAVGETRIRIRSSGIKITMRLPCPF